MEQAVLALIGAIFGGVGLKIVETILDRTRTKDNTEHLFRVELMDEIKILRESLRTTKEERDKFQDMYHQEKARTIGWLPRGTNPDEALDLYLAGEIRRRAR